MKYANEMKNINLILESIALDSKIQMLEENEANPNTFTELDVLRTQKLLQENLKVISKTFENGMLEEVQTTIANLTPYVIEEAMNLTDQLLQEFSEEEVNQLIANDNDNGSNYGTAAGAAGALGLSGLIAHYLANKKGTQPALPYIGPDAGGGNGTNGNPVPQLPPRNPAFYTANGAFRRSRPLYR